MCATTTYPVSELVVHRRINIPVYDTPSDIYRVCLSTTCGRLCPCNIRHILCIYREFLTGSGVCMHTLLPVRYAMQARCVSYLTRDATGGVKHCITFAVMLRAKVIPCFTPPRMGGQAGGTGRPSSCWWLACALAVSAP